MTRTTQADLDWPSWIPKLDSVEAFVVHHSESSSTKTIEQIHRDHKAKGYGGIAYHYVLRDGLWIACRPANLKGTHAPGWNSRSIALCVLGDFRHKDPDDLILMSVINMLATLFDDYGPQPVLSHREAMALVGDPGHTDCPGRDWMGIVRKGITASWIYTG